jgi:hypothetical protein
MKMEASPISNVVTPAVSRDWLRLRLQVMLAKLDYKLHKVPNDSSLDGVSGYFLAATCEMAMVAAEGGLNGFASICLRMAERLEPYRRRRLMPDSKLQALGEWMLHADRYLRRPSSRVRTTSLVRRLNDAAWSNPLGRDEGDRLIEEFLSDWNSSVRDESLAHTPH